MQLETQQAIAIVREINSVLPQKINLMDTTGHIIASTDPNRVGTYHGGAARIIAENLDELRIFTTHDYPGARPGTNFMLKASGAPIGVLGITGGYDTILPLANVIRKMTELLVHEQEHLREQASRERQKHAFLEELLTASETFLTKSNMERGHALGIDLLIPRRVLVAGLKDHASHDLHDICRTLEADACRRDPCCRCTMMGQNIVLLTSISGDEEIAAFAREFLQHAAAFSPALCIGIDSPAADNTHLHTAYLQAQKALASCRRKGNVSIKSYAEINMEIVADFIPLSAKRDYIEKIFHGYTPLEREAALRTLECYYEHDGSIAKTAAALYIHKNTLQQHLRKIARRTGYDPRSLRASAVFYLVLYFYPEVKQLV
ncbi:MAG: CdaR family transcriptional regulator [Mitsuokella sp.]